MTPEERWQRIEEKHLALAESVEVLTADVREMQIAMQSMQTLVARWDKRERKTRDAILAAITAYLKAMQNGEEA